MLMFKNLTGVYRSVDGKFYSVTKPFGWILWDADGNEVYRQGFKEHFNNYLIRNQLIKIG